MYDNYLFNYFSFGNNTQYDNFIVPLLESMHPTLADTPRISTSSNYYADTVSFFLNIKCIVTNSHGICFIETTSQRSSFSHPFK